MNNTNEKTVDIMELINNNYSMMAYVVVRSRAAYRDGTSWKLHDILSAIVRQENQRKSLVNLWDKVTSFQSVKIHDKKCISIGTDENGKKKYSYIPIIPQKELILTDKAKENFNEEKYIGHIDDGISEDIPQIAYLALLEKYASEEIVDEETFYSIGFKAVSDALDKHFYLHKKATWEAEAWEAFTSKETEQTIYVKKKDIDKSIDNIAFSQIINVCHDIIITSVKKIKVTDYINVFDMMILGHSENAIEKRLSMPIRTVRKYKHDIRNIFDSPKAYDKMHDFIMESII